MLLGMGLPLSLLAQDRGLTNTVKSPHAQLRSVNLEDVQWTDGFWAERFEVVRNRTVPFMWELYHETSTHAVLNFEIAAGKSKGKHKGPSFHDGDFYKVFEAMASLYAITKDPELDEAMDQAIALIAAAQRGDGYLHTPVIIEERWGTLGDELLQKQLSFEKYNMGHLMTAACVHYRATGKESFLQIAKGVADFLYDFYKEASPELARNAICPSHYMGVTEMYRTLGDSNYLELAQNLIDIRGTTADGTDDNQDRVPFRQQTEAMGHAVRANYLYAGVADLYAETGEDILMENLKSIWKDVVYRKMYVNGGCGALYDGVSPDGTSYDPSEIQKIHQAYGKPYQLPHATAHNETCANIGNVLWNWRMFQLTKEAEYTDIIELNLYNSILSGISLEGSTFFYTNPLSAKEDLPFNLRWPNEREPYIEISNCCAPNVARTLAQVNNYAYSLSEEGVYVNLYGSNELSTKLWDGKDISIKQSSQYPWEETVSLTIEESPEQPFGIFLRIPGWCKGATIKVNDKEINAEKLPGSYLEVKRNWKTGDVISLTLPMPVNYMEANPLVETTKNQLAVKKGPLVYCVESIDLPEGEKIDNLVLSLEEALTPEWVDIYGSALLSLKGKALFRPSKNWESSLFQPYEKTEYTSMPISLIPYYAWANRGDGEMAVWLPYK